MASFSGGAVGVISALMLVEIRNVRQQEKKRCTYCHGTGIINCLTIRLPLTWLGHAPNVVPNTKMEYAWNIVLLLVLTPIITILLLFFSLSLSLFSWYHYSLGFDIILLHSHTWTWFCIIGYLPCARCSASGMLLNSKSFSLSCDNGHNMWSTTERCPNCSGAGKVPAIEFCFVSENSVWYRQQD